LERWSERREADIGKDRMDLAKKQFDYYARFLSAGENPYSDKPDADGVKNTRIYLANFKGPQRIYVGLLANAAKKDKPITFNQWAEGSSEVLLSAYPVQFAFRKEGAKFMLQEIANAHFDFEKWVLGDYAGQSEDMATMQKGITDLYVKDFIKQWRSVLSTSRFVPYKDPKDAVKKLSTLTSSTAPILALFSWTSQNTAVDVPGVKEAFRAVQQVEPPGAVAYVPSAQPYNDSLQNLQASIEKWVEANADPNAAKPVQEMADAARKETRKISSTLPADPDAHVENVVGELMLKPIIDAERLAKPPDPSVALNQAGAGFCQAFSPIVKKFPFNQSARDEATLQELGDVFKPTGSKLSDFEDKVKNVIVCKAGSCNVVDKPPAPVNPAFRIFLSQAAKLSYALYGDTKTDPEYHYTLTPVKSLQVDSFELAVNGDVSKLAGGDPKSFVWPGGGKPSFKLSLTLAGGTATRVQNHDGLWSLFRFFADADSTTARGAGYDFVWTVTSGVGSNPLQVGGKDLKYDFTVDANIFSKEFLAGMRCVPTVALPAR
jgi:type VI protein secretion system component VasK